MMGSAVRFRLGAPSPLLTKTHQYSRCLSHQALERFRLLRVRRCGAPLLGTLRVQLRVQLFDTRGGVPSMLTQFVLTNAKPYKLADMGGLHLLVKPTGARLWR